MKYGMDRLCSTTVKRVREREMKRLINWESSEINLEKMWSLVELLGLATEA